MDLLLEATTFEKLVRLLEIRVNITSRGKYRLLERSNDGGPLLDATVYVIWTDVAVDEVTSWMKFQPDDVPTRRSSDR